MARLGADGDGKGNGRSRSRGGAMVVSTVGMRYDDEEKRCKGAGFAVQLWWQ